MLFEALNLSLYRSKFPDWFGLYSTPKACTILILIFTSWLTFRFWDPLLCKILSNLKFTNNDFKTSPAIIFIVSAILFRLCILDQPCKVGEDVALQMLTAKQWIDGISSSPNLLVSPNSYDLSTNTRSWILRPPGASWIPLPGLLLGFPLGYSIQGMLFILGVFSALGWLKLAKSFSISGNAQCLLAIILSLNVAVNSIMLSTSSVITASTFPWLLIWALNIGKEWNENKSIIKLNHWFFFASIGMHAFFKLSSLITLSAVASLPFLLLLSGSFRVSPILGIRIISSILIFLTPFFVSSSMNERMSGVSTNELYSAQDYNAQYALWGKHFTESTRGVMLPTSLIASIGYASPIQPLTHRFRDFLLQFKNYTEYLDGKGINSRILGCCIISIPFSVFLFVCLSNLRSIICSKTFTSYVALFLIPFGGFAAISYHHGFNYLIYPSYTKEFSIIFILFGLSFLSKAKKESSFTLREKAIIALLVALPIITTTKSFYSISSHSSQDQAISMYEKNEGFGYAKFSKSLELISNDSKSTEDVCLFLCAGDAGDHCLRIPLRSLSLHFSKGNIQSLPLISSSQSLNLYCLIDPKLSEDQSFIKEVLSKIPKSALLTRLDPLTWRVEIRKIKS